MHKSDRCDILAAGREATQWLALSGRTYRSPPPQVLGGGVAARFDSPAATNRTQLVLASSRADCQFGPIASLRHHAGVLWSLALGLERRFIPKQDLCSRCSSGLRARGDRTRPDPSDGVCITLREAWWNHGWTEFDLLRRSGASIHSQAPVGPACSTEPPFTFSLLRSVLVAWLDFKGISSTPYTDGELPRTQRSNQRRRQS